MTYEANEEKNQNNRKSLQASTRKTHDQAPVISTRKDRQGSKKSKAGRRTQKEESQKRTLMTVIKCGEFSCYNHIPEMLRLFE